MTSLLDRARPALLAGISAILHDHRRSEAVLSNILREQSEWPNDLRSLAARRLHGVACLRARLCFMLAQIGAPATPAWLIAAHAFDVDGATPDDAAREAGLRPSHAVMLHKLGKVRWPTGDVERLAIERSLPRWLAALWVRELGLAQADALAAATNAPGPLTLRTNTLKTSRDALLEHLRGEGIACEPTELSPWGVRVRDRFNVFGSEAWRAGWFEVQDEASQLVALAAQARSGHDVLDACAGSGGKTLALAAMMANQGVLHAYDIDEQRLADLRGRLTRAGVTCVSLGNPSPRADVVLVDAPCSSLGTLRRGPDVRWHTDPDDLEHLPLLQRRILWDAAAQVRRGGRLVYATCTLHRRENEEIADAFEASHRGFVRAPCPWQPGPMRATLMPHLNGTDGFFITAWDAVRD